MKIELTRDLDTCRALRRQVFIQEQNVSEAEEWDGLDATALHLLAWDGARPVGTARLLITGDSAKIGRVCVLRDMRGRGIGAQVMRAAIEVLRERGLRRAKLASQTHALAFYEKLGFVAYGPEYPDAGIPHRDMVLEL
ncbi:GNAT family N-acetyltransferase [Paracoccus jeotgali]|uniref:GNAT family N-acetyltransferase n=1 Tax=Paracoccus jeotgali TaxID=2065379 RepID=UPI0028A9483D|nr:GNAT family N-acetyltransferase [Paracoccus jeotgali]